MASARLANKNQAVDVAREAAVAFNDADSNNDGFLEWDEFMESIVRMRAKSGADPPKAADEAKFRALASVPRAERTTVPC